MSYPVELRGIAWGDAGILQTLKAMEELVGESQSDPLLVRAAEPILATARSREDLARGIRRYLEDRFRWAPDPSGLEFLRSPGHMLARIRARGFVAGDCDDAAILAAALARFVGLELRWHLVGFDEGPWSHVYAEAWTPTGWRDFDVTRPAQFPVGLTIAREDTLEVG